MTDHFLQRASADPRGSVRARFEQDRSSLLDLGLRNTLLNHRELKARGIRIVDEKSEQIYRILVLAERTMSFDGFRGKEDPDEDDSNVFRQPEDEPEVADRHLDDKLQTPYSDKKLQSRLLKTHYAARTTLEERGVNVLYLALGSLVWFEAGHGKIERRAPLVLIPVELYRTSVQARFKLKYSGAEIGPNRSLELKLKTDFGVDSPPFLDPEEPNLSKYFSEVRKRISRFHRWKVEDDEIYLGFFSFFKLLMYEDLDEKKWPEKIKPSEQELICGLLEDGLGGDAVELFPEDRLDDVLDPSDVYQVLDADSSQTIAIQQVLAGQHLVIQGPPGTGKSQTITNVIAETVAVGKTVLFVAEKMAALEVVHRRLQETGLGDACLELHSHTANKRMFIEELSRVLRLGKPGESQRSDLGAALRANRERLNAYATAVNAPIGETGISPFLAYGGMLEAQRLIDEYEPPALDPAPFENLEASAATRLLEEVQELQASIARMGLPLEHPFWGSAAKLFVVITDGAKVSNAARAVLDHLDQYLERAREVAGILGIDLEEDPKNLERLLSHARMVLESPKLKGVAIQSNAWTEEADRLQKGIDLGLKIDATKKEHSGLLDHAWDQSIAAIRGPIAASGSKWWRFFSSAYRGARRELGGLFRGTVPKSGADQLKAIDAVLHIQNLRKEFGLLQQTLEDTYGDRAEENFTDWKEWERIFLFLSGVHEKVAEEEITSFIFDSLAAGHSSAKLASAVQGLRKAREKFDKCLRKALAVAGFDMEVAEFLKQADFADLRKRLRIWEQEPGRLHEIAQFNHRVHQLESSGLGELGERAATWPGAAKRLKELFLLGRYVALLDRAFRERSILAQFDGASHSAVRDRFQKVDKEFLRASSVAVARRHWAGLPSPNGVGQVGILMHEIQKKRRHLPIRKLMIKSGNAIQAIKPVFMMSPMSVAAFLPPGSTSFDLVVFDEASQIRPVEAYGALLRARQAVVVGDSRQLPPTSFFDRNIEVDDDDEQEEHASDLESILGHFVSKGAQQRMLRWHYRSRHESLIALSNREFYDDRLTIFPSPDAGRQDLGLLYHYLPQTHYERGRGRSFNRGEAREIAKAVMKHARTRPDRTLGVAAFSVAQAQVLQDEIEIARRRDPSCEGFFSSHSNKPFFVKNLENVQGDERDVIFISVGYGRDEEGYLAMNFGPLNREGGERRLNVLITRARFRCEVFTNLKSQDIDLERSSARGVIALKRYLHYAETGDFDVPQATGEGPDSPFEAEVAGALRDRGLTVDLQVGSGGFLIDLAVRDPSNPARYLLGIECDGASYHSARWARDRDRLRQEVLEGLGWTIYRIWSTDWFQKRAKEIRRLLKAVELAKMAPTNQSAPAQSPAAFEVPREEERDRRFSEEEGSPLPPYVISEINIPGDLISNTPAQIADWVYEVVEQESPVHVDEVISRITSAAGYKRAGQKIRSSIEEGMQNAVHRGVVRQDGEFLCNPMSPDCIARDRSLLPSSSRRIEMISPTEIQQVIREQVFEAHGILREEVPASVCRRFGYARVTENMAGIVDAALETLLEEGALLEDRDLIVAPRKKRAKAGMRMQRGNLQDNAQEEVQQNRTASAELKHGHEL